MFSKKKEPKQRSRPAGSLAQYGIFEIPDNFDNLGGDVTIDEGDDDLEAELAALADDGNNARQKPQRRARPKPVPDDKLDKMVSESMKDINSDEELSGGEDDPDLLNELKLITEDGSEPGVIEDPAEHETEKVSPNENDNSTQELIKLLEERLTLYKKAEQKAKAANETSRARRYGRGTKTLEEMLLHAQSGRSVDEADIPPILPPSATGEATVEHAEDMSTNDADNSPHAPSEGNVKAAPAAVDQEKLDLLKKRQQEYKVAAVSWKKAGNLEEAMNHVKVAKQFDIVISALCAGDEIDLSDMPPIPTLPTATNSAPVPSESSEKTEDQTQTGAASEVPSPAEQAQPPSGPEDIESALKERLEVYRRTKATAESEGNSSKARRYGRICKQFEDALKLHARGKPVPLDELPTPPGFPPLSTAPQPNSTVPDPESTPAPVSPPAPKPSIEDTINSDGEKKSPVVPVRPNRARKPNQKITSRADKQLAELLQRQHELKQAALAAKKDGDLELARDYLRQSKGIQPLIEASKGGLPVDMTTIPLSPLAKMELSAHNLDSNADDNFLLVSSVDCAEEATGTDEQIYENLEGQLLKQIKWCLATRDHSKALGDVPGYNKWERLALGYTRDLDMLRVRKRDALPPPQHHYETKTYAIVQSCTDLNDGDIEISIIRGINYSREADTYVIYEFPYPTDNGPTDRTSTVKGTRNPEYQAVFPLTDIVERSSRQCQRAFRRHALKCQVWARGCSLNPILCCTHPRGFFRSDSLLGTVTVKLQPLESQCTLHDSFPLMEGRKATGGKLEVKMRLRNPIVTKQIEQITDKWLIIDH